MRRYHFFFNDTATTEIYTLSLHDALPIYINRLVVTHPQNDAELRQKLRYYDSFREEDLEQDRLVLFTPRQAGRSEEHTSELQSRQYLVCPLLLEKKNRRYRTIPHLSTLLK